uniref:Outer membrane protein beta-barrel domain-containing protein n=1 Tax=Ignavibacterium album TaxID=591197 RepID=A0A832G1P0_9BACT
MNLKNILFVLIVLLYQISISAQQNQLRASMGIDFINTPSLIDYINQSNFASDGSQLPTFNTAVNFSGEYGKLLNENFQLSIELAYLLYSYNASNINGRYDISYDLIMPSLLAFYVVSGKGYDFKFGGGAGIRFLSVDETLPASARSDNYTSTGFGAIIRAEGNTLLGGNVYANVITDIRYDINGEPKGNLGNLRNNVLNENVNFNSLSVGIKLGVSYFF